MTSRVPDWGRTSGADHDRVCPSYEDLRIQSVITAYVIGEGHHDETIFELANRFSPDEGDAVERAVRDLIAGGVLSMNRGKVVPRLASLAGQHGE